MKALALVALAVLSLAGCGGGPLCESPSRRADFITGCTSGAASSASFCACAYEELASTHTCQQLDAGDISFSAMRDAADACM